MQLTEYKAVVFDMDGLLIDTETISMRTFFESCEQFGVSVSMEAKLGAIGRNGPATRDYLAPYMGGYEVFDKVRKVWLARYFEEAVEKPVPLMAGARALLDWLKSADMPLAVATSSGVSSAPKKLKNAGLDHFFPIVVTGDQVENSKPAPDIYLLAAEKLGIAPQECVAFEDSANGVIAAVGAGMTVVQVPDKVPVSAELRTLNHLIVESLEDILAIQN